MLLQGAYSAKYRAAVQEKLDNLKDEERQEFNVKLEKTKELSRDTNRRRRALEERRKNYEAEEERKRREILAQRKKEIQDATEKFQRSNFIRNQKKIKQTERIVTPTRTVKHDNTRPVSAKAPKVINGKPYYPSVEEVMALLHANRKNVVKTVTVDNQPRDTHRDDISEPTAVLTDKAAEEREQEKLRNEVVGRIEPKIAFSDKTKDITSGVLPTTIRRNSPAGSLSSIDSLDTVPDDEVETMPTSTRNPIAGIIRKRTKVKTDSRVTFNENVAFSDGVVGTLKRKQGIESLVDSSVVPKQKSYFGLSDMGNESKPKANGTDSESSKDSLILNQYLSRQCQSNVPSSNPHGYPHVDPSDIGTTGVMTYSMSNNDNLQSGKNLTPTTLKTNALHVLPSSPRVNGVSYGGYTMSSQTGSPTVSNNNEKNQTWKMDSTSPSVNGKNYVSHTNQMPGFQTGSVPKNNSFEESSAKTQVNGNDAHSHNDVNRKFNERPSLSFSSINASMLKDSLEMHSGVRVSQSDQNIAGQQTQQPKVEFRPPNPKNSSSGYVSIHSEIPPETPLIPVTKTDFLSKALRSDSSGVHDGKIEESSHRYSRGNYVSKSERETPVDGYRMYNQEHDVRQNKQITLENGSTGLYDSNSYNQKQIVSNSNVTNMTPSAHNDKYNRDRTVQNLPDDSYSEKHATSSREVRDMMGYSCKTASTPYYSNSSGHVNSSLNQGHQVMSRDNHGITTPHRTNDESSTATPSTSRTDSTEKLSATHNMLGITDTVTQPSDRPGDRQPSSANELLKSVQENIERLSMTPSQQGTSKTSSRIKLSETYSATPYKTRISEGRHNRTFSDSGRRQKPFNTTDTSPSFDSKGCLKATANGRKIGSRRGTSNGQRLKVEKEKKVNENNKRFHRSGSDSAITNQGSGVNMVYGTVQNSNHEIAAGKNTERNQSTRPNQVYTSPNHKTDHQSASYRMHNVSSEARGLQPQPNAFERKQRKNSGGLGYLDKTPTDEEINHLWETVRTCLKHEQPQKAASDSIVNNVRYSRSDSGPLVGNHYLIDGNAWAVKPTGGSDNETHHSRGTASIHFRRQGSLDSLQRRGSTESGGYIPLRKGSLLQHRSSTSERRLTSRNSPGARPPINPQYLQSLRGPLTSSRGPVKSNTVKTEGRPQLSYAEFQAVLQASADIKTRNTEGDSRKSSRQNVHQPIIMNYRKEPSALSLEEKRLLESLDRLNERLKVQETFAGKIVNSPRNGNIQSKTSSSKFLQPSSTSGSRFGNTRSPNDNVPKSNSGVLNRR